MPKLQPRQVMRDPILLLATGFGSGLVPRMPGTAGSVLGVAAFYPMLALPMVTRVALVLALTLAGIHICAVAARKTGVHDHPAIVWDEICGIWVTLLVVPAQPGWWLAAFALFRVFDIWKPWPIRRLDKNMRGGLGIMADDVLAAVFAAMLLSAAEIFVLFG